MSFFAAGAPFTGVVLICSWRLQVFEPDLGRDMKDDQSAFEEGGETQFCARFGAALRGSAQSEAPAQRGSCNGGSEIHGGCSKRLNGSSSLIVYARRVRPRNGFTVHAGISGVESFEGLREIDVADDVTVERQSDGTSDFSMSGVEVETDRNCLFDEEPDSGLVEVVMQEDFSRTVRGRQSREETKILAELDGLVDVVIREDDGQHETSPVHKIEEGQTSVSHAVEYEATPKVEGDANAETADVAIRNNLELKMSKMIVSKQELVTVSDLLDTGLLDGVTVVYMGGSKTVHNLCYK